MFMASSRSPDINYNGSGYFDETARNAIINADRKQLTERRKRVINKFYEIAAAEGFRIDSYIKLSEIGDEEMYKDCFARTERCSFINQRNNTRRILKNIPNSITYKKNLTKMICVTNRNLER